MVQKDIFDYINPFTRKLKPVFDFAGEHPYYFSIMIVSLIIFSFFLSVILKVFLISLFIFVGGISKIYQRYTSTPIAIELVMFSTVIAGFVYGPAIGAVVGASSFLLATFFSARYNPIYVFMSLVVYVIAGTFSSLFGNVVIAGIVFTLLFVIVLSIVSILTLFSRVDRVLMFALSSLLWNIGIFISIAPDIVGLLR